MIYPKFRRAKPETKSIGLPIRFNRSGNDSPFLRSVSYTFTGLMTKCSGIFMGRRFLIGSIMGWNFDIWKHYGVEMRLFGLRIWLFGSLLG